MSYIDIINNKIDEQIEEDPEWLTLAVRVLSDIKSGFFPRPYVDMVMQHDWHHKPDHHDALVFAHIHCALAEGQCLWCKIRADREPHSNSAKDDNNAILSHLPPPFRGSFDGRAWGIDGTITWDSEIRVASISDSGTFEKTLPPGVAPLEVGYCHAQTTFDRLAEYRSVARFPYDSRWIYLLVVVEDRLWSADYALEQAGAFDKVTPRWAAAPLPGFMRE